MVKIHPMKNKLRLVMDEKDLLVIVKALGTVSEINVQGSYRVYSEIANELRELEGNGKV